MKNDRWVVDLNAILGKVLNDLSDEIQDTVATVAAGELPVIKGNPTAV